MSFLMFTGISAKAQSSDFSIKEWKSVSQTPLVFLISGDGGFNSFTTNLCTAINNAGYSITALSGKSYFWDKKTPQQTTTDIENYIKSQLQTRKNKEFILIGYSFGADVAPFVVNLLADSNKKQLQSLILLSPSTSTDFEVHLSDMFGKPKKRSMDVVAEINKLGAQKTTLIFGDDEDDFPKKEIVLKNVVITSLAGGHHYDGNTTEVAKTMMMYFK